VVVIYFKSDSRIRVIVLVEDDPSVINAINDGLITGLLNGTGSYPFHAKECSQLLGAQSSWGDGILRS